MINKLRQGKNVRNLSAFPESVSILTLRIFPLSFRMLFNGPSQIGGAAPNGRKIEAYDVMLKQITTREREKRKI